MTSSASASAGWEEPLLTDPAQEPVNTTANQDRPRRRAQRPPAIRTPELERLLHDHFIRPEDRDAPNGAGAVYLTEVVDPEGRGRRADAVHIGLWQSRGAGRIDVCELKTSRADFRRELAQKAKAEAWWKYSTAFWIVSPGIHITPPDELPEKWGLMVPGTGKRRFQVVVKPEEREPELTVGLLLTLLKNTETRRTKALHEQANRLGTEHHRRTEELRTRLASAADPNVARRLKLLDELEAALAVEVGEFSWGDVLAPGQAAAGLAEFMQGHRARLRAQQTSSDQARMLDDMVKSLQNAARQLRAAPALPVTGSEP
ncbi:hypothetical protein ACWD0J_20760 [Streptomyces sp. NPDC003011]